MTLSGLETLLISVFTLLLMLGMGATLSIRDFGRVLQHPLAPAIGLASQFGWMPMIAFGLATALELSPALGVGLIIMGCSAGGTTSNFFTYLSRGDLALSLSMTVISTLAGILIIPLVLMLWATPFLALVEGGEFAIPFASIATTLFVLLVPIAIGIVIRSRSERWAKRIEKTGTYAGFAVLILVIAGSALEDGRELLLIPTNVYIAATVLGPIGFLLGYLSARLASLPAPQRRAVSLETGIQNAALAFAIILISFPAELHAELLPAPLMYGVIVVPFSAFSAWLFRRYPHL